MKQIVTVVIVLIVAFLSASESVYLTVKNPDNALVRKLDIVHREYARNNGNGTLQFLADVEMLDFIEKNNYEYTVRGTREELQRELEEYHNYSEVLTELEEYSSSYDDIVQLSSLGPSYGKIYYDNGNNSYSALQHEIWLMKVSDNPDVEEDEPNVFIGGGIHGREVISVEVAMFVLQHILENYGTDDAITELVDNNQIWFVPLMNPDGHRLSVYELDLFHRKNMRDNNENQLPNYSSIDGVDLNRNFGYVWGNNHASDAYSSELYHGPEAWSEPEVCYIRDLIRERRFWGAITYHSSGEYVMYPLGFLDGVCSYDHEIMGALSDAMAESIPRINAMGYYQSIQCVDYGYTCQGTMGDWGYSEQRIFGFTIELADESFPEEIDEICQDNLEAALMFIGRASQSTLSGVITDPERNPLVADVYVEEIDGQEGMTPVEPSRSNAMFGRYIRPLLPGSYTVRFEHENYNPITVEDVEIHEDSNTYLNITMGGSGVDNDIVAPSLSIVNYPNPFNPETIIAMSLPSSTNIDVTLYDVKGRKVKKLFSGRSEQNQLRLTWDGTDDQGSKVSSGIYFVQARTASCQLTHKLMLVK